MKNTHSRRNHKTKLRKKSIHQILFISSLFILFIGITTTAYLTQKNQDIRKKAMDMEFTDGGGYTLPEDDSSSAPDTNRPKTYEPPPDEPPPINTSGDNPPLKDSKSGDGYVVVLDTTSTGAKGIFYIDNNAGTIGAPGTQPKNYVVSFIATDLTDPPLGVIRPDEPPIYFVINTESNTIKPVDGNHDYVVSMQTQKDGKIAQSQFVIDGKTGKITTFDKYSFQSNSSPKRKSTLNLQYIIQEIPKKLKSVGLSLF